MANSPNFEASQNDSWLPIVDFAVTKGISTSTLRRYIKANKVQYKVENGRYLIRSDKTSNHSGNGRVKELEQKLLAAQEQINELKMLVAIYEEKLSELDR